MFHEDASFFLFQVAKALRTVLYIMQYCSKWLEPFQGYNYEKNWTLVPSAVYIVSPNRANWTRVSN